MKRAKARRRHISVLDWLEFAFYRELGGRLFKTIDQYLRGAKCSR